jgi:hypothetical protein
MFESIYYSEIKLLLDSQSSQDTWININYSNI